MLDHLAFNRTPHVLIAACVVAHWICCTMTATTGVPGENLCWQRRAAAAAVRTPIHDLWGKPPVQEQPVSDPDATGDYAGQETTPPATLPQDPISLIYRAVGESMMAPPPSTAAASAAERGENDGAQCGGPVHPLSCQAYASPPGTPPRTDFTLEGCRGIGAAYLSTAAALVSTWLPFTGTAGQNRARLGAIWAIGTTALVTLMAAFFQTLCTYWMLPALLPSLLTGSLFYCASHLCSMAYIAEAPDNNPYPTPRLARNGFVGSVVVLLFLLARGSGGDAWIVHFRDTGSFYQAQAWGLVYMELLRIVVNVTGLFVCGVTPLLVEGDG